MAICAAERADSFQALNFPSLPGSRTGHRNNTPCRFMAVKRIFGVTSVGNSDHKCGATRYVSFSSFRSMTAVSMRNVGSGVHPHEILPTRFTYWHGKERLLHSNRVGEIL